MTLAVHRSRPLRRGHRRQGRAGYSAAIPIGIGKPVLLVNALYKLAESDRRLSLRIFTGLSLTRPRYRNSLE